MNETTNPTRAKSAAAKAGTSRRAARANDEAIAHRAPQARAVAARETILKAAIKIFSKSGFDGARIETISKAARTHDRMIYYYFGSKEKLFVEVLETVYQRMNAAEAALVLDLSNPVDALTTIVRFHWKYYLNHPDLLTLLNSENMHRGKHFRKAPAMTDVYPPAVAMLERVLISGVDTGVFRKGVSPRDLYIVIVSLGYFYQSNRYTLSAFLNEEVMEEARIVHWQEVMVDNVLRIVIADAAYL
ncbi:TetR/AcrR family transcriptional regulator [Paraburkholderia sp. 22B1P]|uniref:TetR/AcrR family transcriptional regulator n=1 Tax=Paraburkholderia sp. 22B1P TaxID=3080498 RepID=UPI003091510F|nr:TetR family transcriptional regulator [Paraburkholderia sp. 22B1P]